MTAMTQPRIPLTDPRVTQLAAARQQLAHEGVFLPAWTELTDEERAQSLPDARSYLMAAIRCGLISDDAEVSRLRGQLEAAHCRLHYVAARLEHLDVRDDPTGVAGDVGPYLDGPLHPQDLADYRAAVVNQGRERSVR